MGEGRRKNLEQLAIIRKEMERLTVPYTPEEEALAAEIKKLPVLDIGRGPPEQLQWMRMRPQYCHDNALWMEANDPEKECRAVHGWAVKPGIFILHSVIRQRGDLVCVTPTSMGVHEDSLYFVPDDRLVCKRMEGGQFLFTREEYPVSFGVRSDPAFIEAFWKVVATSLEAGKSAQAIMADSSAFAAKNWTGPMVPVSS
jgi:hypothetical protein